ncbi:DNA-3-methyladenine glycosylase family protein [Sulfurisphaera tokodaii]|uniref:DNA glycosylase n=2 Tax=Sulfurisphaera tokodaii TaxID=111955 RepID=Q972N8_SULTO|nr:DNA-3-methyladenine glycosylase [Sulfurisphaera tokodaii]BAB66126.1 putative DNA glycosylase [Sulfurisphaera tokodaii str. 7]HII74494.1 DNA-3-methyladenine glycosylase 2 family protein [Sulfurisphaera tokodaii]
MRSVDIDDIVPPFNLLYTTWLLKRVKNNKIDEILPDKSYVRVFNRDVIVKVKQIGGIYNPKLRVEIFSSKDDDEEGIIKTLRRVLGLDVDLTNFYNRALDNPYFSSLARKFIGAKPVVFPTLLETVTNVISCQQISLNVCLTLVNKLAEKFGGKVIVDDKQINVFPTVEDLINSKPEELRSLGYSSRKVEYILNAVNALKDKDSFESIKNLKGLGKWSINYILLRGLGRIDVIPTGDVGFRNKAKRFLGIDNIEEILSSVKEYSGMIYYYLLLENLYHEGLL